MVPVIPIASVVMTSIAILVTEFECIPIVRADACHACRCNQRDVVTIRATGAIIGITSAKALVISLVIIAASRIAGWAILRPHGAWHYAANNGKQEQRPYESC